MKELIYNNLQRWIPPSDVDGVDLKPEIASTARNIIFQNGFFKNAVDTVNKVLPSLVQGKIDIDYQLIGYTNFNHSTQGFHEVYILWSDSASSSEKLLIYLDNTLLGFETGDNISYPVVPVYEEEPYNINFSLVNDQLKINLNCRATLYTIEPTILNLTLLFLKERVYIPASHIRPEGWYLYPRWLGASLHGSGVYLYNEYPLLESIVEDFEDTTLLPQFELGTGGWSIGTPLTGQAGGGAIYVWNDSLNGYIYKTFKIKLIRNLKEIKLKYSFRGVGQVEVGGKISDARIIFKIKKTSEHIRELKEFAVIDLSNEKDYGTRELTIEVNRFETETFEIEVGALCPPRYDSTALTTVIAINDMEFIPAKTTVIGRYFDNQRAFLTSGHPSNEYGVAVFSGGEQLRLELSTYHIDWRITEYEIYAEQNTIFYLVSKIIVEDGAWDIQSASRLKGLLSAPDEEDPIETLNFNYGLGADVLVDTQHLIYNEASFNNRVYAVNGGYRILQTHIAGNGRIQPDAFPYDEDDFLGFIEEAKSSLIQSLFIINNNFLMIYMTNGYSLYQINSSPYTGRFQKELRMLASSFTGFNPKSLTRMINATSPTIGAYWVTNEGIWYHDGSLGSVPINLITDTHRNYWKTVEKTNFGFYDYQDNEYWYATKVYSEIRDGKGADREFTEFIIYEINFKTFRFVRLGKAYYELAGYIDGKPLIRTNTAIGTLDKSNNKSLNGLIETHWNDLGNEYYNKIAQAISIQLKQSYADGVMYLKAQFDDQTIVYSFEVSTNEKEIIRIFPESVRFKSVKLSVLLYNLNQAEISASSFKLIYTEDGIGRFGEFFDHQVIVEGGGYGKAYGRYYGGSNPAGAGGGFGTQYGKHYGN